MNNARIFQFKKFSAILIRSEKIKCSGASHEGWFVIDRYVGWNQIGCYHDKLPPNKANYWWYIVMLRYFSTIFSLSKKSTEIIMCLSIDVYISGKYLYGHFKMFALSSIDHQLFCYVYFWWLGGKNHFFLL